MGIVFYNNWLTFKEIHFIDIQLKYDGCLILSLGLIGCGIVVAINWEVKDEQA